MPPVMLICTVLHVAQPLSSTITSDALSYARHITFRPPVLQTWTRAYRHHTGRVSPPTISQNQLNLCWRNQVAMTTTAALVVGNGTLPLIRMLSPSLIGRRLELLIGCITTSHASDELSITICRTAS
ncbi:hypothetical protein GQ44DRAFT_708133 [Phaeosphaeriaceae sp. PMI808]|nr:hypothetical protein GQ44DRAFT_708133 [Phaeosphaeriaceae sp. PMI808]